MRRAALGAVVAAALLAAGCTSSSSPSPAPVSSQLNDHTDATYDGLGLDPAQPRPQFTLTDTAGKSVKFSSLTQGKPTLLYFGYTNCPDVCPTTMADIAQALRTVPATVRKATEVVFVTTDVKRDTPTRIKAWLSKFDPGLPNKFIGLTGTQAEIDAAQVAAHVTLAEDMGQTHSAQVLLYGRDDYARVAFLQSTDEATQITHDLPVIYSAK